MPNILILTFRAVMMFLSTSNLAMSRFISSREYHYILWNMPIRLPNMKSNIVPN